MAAYESLLLKFGVLGVDDVAKATTILNSELTQMKRSLSILDTEQRTLGRSTEGLTDRKKLLGEMMKKNSIIMDNAKRDLQSYVAAQKKQGIEVDETDRSVQRYIRTIRKAENTQQELEVQLKSTENAFERMGQEVKQTEAQMDKFDRVVTFSMMMGLREFGQELSQVASAFTNYATEAYLASKSTKAAVETMNRNFGDLSDEQMLWAQQTAESLGLFEGDLIATSSKIYGLSESYGMLGNMFAGTTKDMVLNGGDLATISQDLTLLAYDLAATYDTTVDQALTAVLSGYRGNIAAIEDYGISLQATMLQEQANKLGIEKKVDTMTQAEKNYLAYKVMMESTTKSQGRWSEELEAGLIPQLELENSLKKLSVAFGDALEPAISKALGFMNDIVKATQNADPAIYSLVGGLGVAAVAMAAFATASGLALMLATTFGASVGVAFAGIITVTAGLTAVAYGLFESFRTGKPFMQAISDGLIGIKTYLDDLLPGLGTAVLVVGGFVTALSALRTGLYVFGILKGVVGTISLFTGALSAGSGIMGAFGAASGVAAAGATAVGAGGAVAAGGLGAMTAAAAPVVLALAGVAAAVAGVIWIWSKWQEKQNSLTIEPEIKYSEGVSEIAQKNVEAYKTMDQEMRMSIDSIASHQTVVTKETVQATDTQLTKMTDLAKGKLEEKYGKAIEAMKTYYLQSGGVIDENEQKNLDILTSRYEEEISEYDQKKNRILEIQQGAADEGRTLLQQEQDEINQILRNMQFEAIGDLTASEKEKAIILNDWNNQKDSLTADYISKQITKSAEARDKTITDATTTRDETIAALEGMRDEIPDDAYDEMVAAANEAYEEQVRAAENTHNEVVKFARSKNAELSMQIDMETGKILSHAEFQQQQERITGEQRNLTAAQYGAEGLKAQQTRYETERKAGVTHHEILNNDEASARMTRSQNAASARADEASSESAHRKDIERIDKAHHNQSLTEYGTFAADLLGKASKNGDAMTKAEKIANDARFRAMGIHHTKSLSEEGIFNSRRATKMSEGMGTYKSAMERGYGTTLSVAEIKRNALLNKFKLDTAQHGSNAMTNFKNGMLGEHWRVESGLGGMLWSIWDNTFGAFSRRASNWTPPTPQRASGNQMYENEPYSLRLAARAPMSIPSVPEMVSKTIDPYKVNVGSRGSVVTPRNSTYNINISMSDAKIYDTRNVQDIAKDLAREMKRELTSKGSRNW